LDVPLWLVAGVLVALLLGVFGWFKYQLSSQSNPLEARIEQIGQRKPAVVKAAKPLNLTQLLKNEIARGVVKVNEQDNRTSVIFTGDNMFAPGSADVNETIKPTLDKVATEINLVSGKVMVTGHTDSSPIKSEKFADNQVLSEQRAKNVAEYLQKMGVAVDRLSSEGKGDTQPVADNKTPQGKAKNRRVEVLVIQ
jgi:type VI secretion system protein ImpK